MRCTICGSPSKHNDLPQLIEWSVEKKEENFILFKVEDIICFPCFNWVWLTIHGEEFTGGYHVSKTYCRCYDCKWKGRYDSLREAEVDVTDKRGQWGD